ncbi:MAG: MFS transporter [Gemmataceae bacterium]|nr:MFS transporter [Gemmataceae bacterium]
MAFQPADSLKSRTFWGLIVAQFLAGFNDQAIHVAAMFYAIHQEVLTEAQAISLMPILFYSPWAIFCTAAGYCADRFSKTYAIIIWKAAEVVISVFLIAGFYIGFQDKTWGVIIVMSTVFMMGTHAAFFAPAKYGAMPEILQPHILSRGNGILESTTFLAAILGTVSGGLLIEMFRGREQWIGWILLLLSAVGAAASLMVAYLKPGDTERRFPWNLYQPLIGNLKVLMKSRPLALSVLGIAFFIFMVSYMRATMYMHGQSRNPPWDEFKTSMVVASVALGVGLGSPLAGFLSGGKIELGLVPLGCVGMILAAILSAVAMDHTTALVVALVIIGFFSGFYMVPLYTLLQHRAPKQKKGDLIATSNFINVTGAIAASLLFYVLVLLAQSAGLTAAVPQEDRVVVGTLMQIDKNKHGKPEKVVVKQDDGVQRTIRVSPTFEFREDIPFIRQVMEHMPPPGDIEFDENLLEVLGGGVQQGDRVIVSKYQLGELQRYRVRAEETPLKPVYDNRGLPKYLFFGAALMTLGILILLVKKLPDFFVRSLFWLRSLGRFRLKAVGMQHLPTDGPVILAANCDRLESSLQLVSATDRSTLFVLWENPERRDDAPLLRALAQRANVVEVSKANHEEWLAAHGQAKKALRHGDLLALTVDGHADDEVESLIADLRQGGQAQGAETPIVPVYCGPIDNGAHPRVRVVFGPAMRDGASLADIRQEIRQLGDWVRANDGAAEAAH